MKLTEIVRKEIEILKIQKEMLFSIDRYEECSKNEFHCSKECLNNEVKNLEKI